MFVAVDTQLPQGDYIRLSAIDVAVERFTSEPSSPVFLMESTTCADEGPDSGDLAFNVVLDPKARRIPLLASAAGVNHIVRQDEPMMLELNVTARATGWYRINVSVRFRHGTQKGIVSLPHSVEFYFPAEQDSGWFYYPLGGPAQRLTAPHIKDIKATMDQWGVGFPPPLAHPEMRSGLRPQPNDTTP